MRNKTLFGLVVTVLIYLISVLIPRIVKIPIDFFPSSFLTHSMMLLLSGFLMSYFHSKKLLSFRIKGIKWRLFFKIILTSVLAFIVVNVVSNAIFMVFNIPIHENKNPFLNFTPAQYFIFVLIYASIAEELLFRGFLLNMLEPIKNRRIKIHKLTISVSVILSGFLFGLAHLILLTTDAGIPFVFRIVFLTTTIGIIAGYFQEKNENNTLSAILVHMTVNALGLLGLFLTLALNK